MKNPTTEERLERLELAILEITRLTAQYTGDTGGGGVSGEAASAPGNSPDALDEIETYVAQGGGSAVPLGGAAGSAAASAFTIEVRFLGGLTQTQRAAFRGAADRWTRVIVGALPSVMVDGELIRGVLILAQGAQIDGPGRVLGQAGPTRLRPASAGRAAFIPAKGEMMFDSADLQEMERRGTLSDVIAHEMGHVLGVGTIWSRKGLLRGAQTRNPMFTGAVAMREYAALRGAGSPQTPVPVENTGGAGTADSHWRDTVFGSELMTGFVGPAGNPLSRLTVASMADLGYGVDLNAAEPYQLPNHLMMAEAGALAEGNELEFGTMLPHLPIVLPAGSLQ